MKFEGAVDRLERAMKLEGAFGIEYIVPCLYNFLAYGVRRELIDLLLLWAKGGNIGNDAEDDVLMLIAKGVQYHFEDNGAEVIPLLETKREEWCENYDVKYFMNGLIAEIEEIFKGD